MSWHLYSSPCPCTCLASMCAGALCALPVVSCDAVPCCWGGLRTCRPRLTGLHQPGCLAVLGSAGTRGPMDLMEVPSHVVERFASAPSSLGFFARHHLSGQPIPADLAQRLQRSQRMFEAITIQQQVPSHCCLLTHTFLFVCATIMPAPPSLQQPCTLNRPGFSIVSLLIDAGSGLADRSEASWPPSVHIR